MWTKVTRDQYARTGLRYASDTTDAEWALIEPLLPARKRRGRPREVALRAVVGAVLYLLRTGCQWRQLPKEFPPYSTVQRYFYAWRDSGLWVRINHILLIQLREAEGSTSDNQRGVREPNILPDEIRRHLPPADGLQSVLCRNPPAVPHWLA